MTKMHRRNVTKTPKCRWEDHQWRQAPDYGCYNGGRKPMVCEHCHDRKTVSTIERINKLQADARIASYRNS